MTCSTWLQRREDARHRGIIRRMRKLFMRTTRRHVRDEQGVAAIEFAFILPILLILMLGATELFLMHMASRKMTRVTSTVGDLITQARGTLTQADIEGYYKAARYIMGQFPTDRLAVSVHTFRWDSRKNEPVLDWQHHLGNFVCRSDEPELTPEQRAAMQDGNDLVVTTGCYRYQVTFGSFALSSTTVDMSDDISLRPRQQLRVECSDCS